MSLYSTKKVYISLRSQFHYVFEAAWSIYIENSSSELISVLLQSRCKLLFGRMSADTLLIVVVNLFNLKRMLGPEATKSLCCQFRYILFTQKRKFGEIVDLGEELHQIVWVCRQRLWTTSCVYWTTTHIQENFQLCIRLRQINASVGYPKIFQATIQILIIFCIVIMTVF